MVNAEHIQKSIDNALAGISNLTQDILSVRGFSTPTIRHLFNNLCNIIEGKYLEVGLYCGATFCSSFNKDTISVGIEDFSQPFGIGTVKEELQKNIHDNLHKARGVKLINGDCFSDGILSEPFKFNIIFYDANHDEENQEKALPYFLDKMAERFIYIVDDTNWEPVITGLVKGMVSINEKIEVIDEWNMVGESICDDPVWHNGVRIFLINKK